MIEHKRPGISVDADSLPAELLGEVVPIAAALRWAYIKNKYDAFIEIATRRYKLDTFTADLAWELIDVVGDLGVDPFGQDSP